MSFQEEFEKRLHRARANRNWLFVKSLFRPSVIIVSYKRSGFQWFRQICYANLRRHAVMPPGARYQHFNIERVPKRNRLNRNALLLVRERLRPRVKGDRRHRAAADQSQQGA